MEHRFASIAALAAEQHGAVSSSQLASRGIDSSARAKWVRRGLLERVGTRSFATAGSPPTWERRLMASLLDLDGNGLVAGRSAARLLGLDGFRSDAPEVLVPRGCRHRSVEATVCSTARPVGRGDVVMVHGFRCCSAERLILDSPLFGFTRTEIEDAIDPAIRLRLVSERRLRDRVAAEHTRGRNGSRRLADALVDSGGESRLERMLLRLLRDAGIDRPRLQVVFRDDPRTVARVDALIGSDLVVEVAGHATHATRRQRQVDEQRRTELVLRGLRVITFTYEDVRDRPAWMICRIREALGRLAS